MLQGFAFQELLMGFFESLLIGISIAAIPGPVFFELVRRTLSKGFWSGVFIPLGQFFANLILITSIFFGMNNLLKNEIYNSILYLAGAIILGWLSFNAFRLKEEEIKRSYEGKISDKNSFFVGFFLAITNPIGIAFWISLAGSYFMQFGSTNLVFMNIFLVAFGFNLVHIPLAWIIYKTRHKISIKYTLLLSKVFGTVLFVYGFSFMMKFIKTLML